MARPKAYYAMLAFRAAFLLAILLFATRSEWSTVIFYGIVFVGSLFVPWLGKKEKDYYVLDCLIMTTFVLSLVPTYFNAWPTPKTLWDVAFGFDKVFHTAAGAVLAMFAAIAGRKHITNKWVFYFGIVAFALAVGGAWEIFEWIFTILPPPLYAWSGGYADTMLDMTADTFGAILVALVLWRISYLKSAKKR